MNTRHKWLAGASAAVAVALVGYRLTRTPRDHARGPERRAGFAGECVFEEGDVRAWRLNARHTQQGHHLSRVEFTLVTRTLAREAHTTSATLAAVVRDVQADPSLRAAAGAVPPFALRIARDCRFEAVGFAPGTSPEDAQRVRGVLMAFDTTLPGTRPVPHWTVIRHEPQADVEVGYRAGANASAPLERVRRRFLPRGGSDRLPTIERSMARVWPAPDARWLDRFEAQERLRLPSETTQALTVDVSLWAERVPAEWTDAPTTTAWLASLDFSEHTVADPAPPTPAVAPEMLALNTPEAIARLGSLYDHRSNGAADEAVTFLVAWLNAHPERAEELLQRIRSRTDPERLGGLTFFAMSKARDPRVLAALHAAVQDGGFDGQSRARAAVAIADSAQANLTSVQTLARVATTRGEDDNEAVRDAALNSIGIVRSHAQGELAEAASAELQRALDRAHGVEDQIDAIDAIGNSTDTRFVPAVERSLESDDPAVRDRAARALGHMVDPTVEAALRARLAVEHDPTTLQGIVASILARTDSAPAAETITVAGARLPDVTDARARGALVQLIGAALRATPTAQAAREALVAWFRIETDARVQALIGQFVSAEELG